MKQYQFSPQNPPQIGEMYWAGGKLFPYQNTAGDEFLIRMGAAFRRNSGLHHEADPGYIYMLLHARGEQVMPVPVFDDREKAELQYLNDPETPLASMPDYYQLVEILKKHVIPYVNLAEGPQD